MPGQKAGEAERREQILAAAYEIAANDGLERLTVRRVAAEARLSHGLVHFHFRRKADLVLALLDWVLERTPEYALPASCNDLSPAERLFALVRQEVTRLASDRLRVHLLLEFWLVGTRHPGIRNRMRREFTRRREAFRPILDEVKRVDPARFRNVRAEALAATLVALIEGAAVQVMLDPRAFDPERFLAAVDALLPALESAA